MTRYRATLEYDGGDFLGFQRQAHGPTVQEAIETALRRIGWPGETLLAAGRTDTGVHAAGQVIAFDFHEWKHGEDNLLRALNANLPGTIAVKSVSEAAPDFHPRFAARSRRYRYTIYNAPVRSPLLARYAWHVPTPELSIETLNEASACLVGRKDFATFGTPPDEGGHTVRTVGRAEWKRAEAILTFDIEADAFLYRMVRSVVGTLRAVGAGEMTPARFGEVLAAADRTRSGPAAPAHGLCLMEVKY
ncbi:MAG: tRNA pseudouridine(38-40) synthase TruA [Chloroflexi bacterium]|nr:tRNA pseudouridine(38-40) synthase TruA [Chloroflexota bacterium]